MHESSCAIRAFASIALIATAGCGADTAHDIAFQAPPGWSGTAKRLGIQAFRKPSDHAEMIILTYPDTPRPASHAVSSRWTPIKICGNHSAVLMQQRGTIENTDVQMDGVDTEWAGKRVMSMYQRPYAKAAYPAAERAIRQLCPSAQR